MGCPAEVFCRKYIKYIDGGSIVAYHGIFFALLVIFFEILAAPKLRWFDGNCWGPFHDLHAGSIRLHVLCKPWHQHELRRPDISRLFFSEGKPETNLDIGQVSNYKKDETSDILMYEDRLRKIPI